MRTNSSGDVLRNVIDAYPGGLIRVSYLDAASV